MKLSGLGEFGLIEKIRKTAKVQHPSLLVGIGDDAAVLKVQRSSLLLATADMLVEGVHFNLAYTDYYSLGWKSAAVNMSDIAAMGGVPRFCLVSLGISSAVADAQIADFYRGFNAVLRSHETALVGGDTCASPRCMTVSVTVLGRIEPKRVLTRSTAKPGDRIFVTGTLGDSAAGLEFLRNAERTQLSMRRRAKKGAGRRSESGGLHYSEMRSLRSPVRKLVERHLRPEPRVAWGRKIALSRCAHAMIDISDGLSSDLWHICEESGVGAAVFADAIPLSPWLRRSAGWLSRKPLRYALAGGEDYELLFTAPAKTAKRMMALGIPVTEIGVITEDGKMTIITGGVKKPLRPSGYDHFVRRQF